MDTPLLKQKRTTPRPIKNIEPIDETIKHIEPIDEPSLMSESIVQTPEAIKPKKLCKPKSQKQNEKWVETLGKRKEAILKRKKEKELHMATVYMENKEKVAREEALKEQSKLDAFELKEEERMRLEIAKRKAVKKPKPKKPVTKSYIIDKDVDDHISEVVYKQRIARNQVNNQRGNKTDSQAALIDYTQFFI